MLKSFFSIAKNGGYFVSTKQATFLLSKCIDGIYIEGQRFSFGTSAMSNHTMSYTVTCDAHGVTKIEKQSQKTAKITVMFERTLDVNAAQELKIQNANKREFTNIVNEAFEIVRLQANEKEEQCKRIKDKLVTQLCNSKDITQYPHLKTVEWLATYYKNKNSWRAFNFICS